MNSAPSIPPSDVFATWLAQDERVLKHAAEPLYFLGRHEHKRRIVKKWLEIYIFVTESGVDFSESSFKAILSQYLRLDHNFELLKVEANKFILTLEAQFTIEYASALLGDGKMIRIGDASVVCYPTDTYAEGYFGGNLSYDSDDEIADKYIILEIHALPLHLWTIKAIERILQPYCIVHSISHTALSSQNLTCIVCGCWTKRGIRLPRYIVIRVCSRFSHQLHSHVPGKHVQTYCIAVTMHKPGFATRFRLPEKTSFAKAVESKQVGCSFLRDVDVSATRIAELQASVLLQPTDQTTELTAGNIAIALQSRYLLGGGKLFVQSIGVHGFIAHSTGILLPQVLQETVGSSKHLCISSHALYWTSWSTAFGAVSEILPRKVTVRTQGLEQEFYAPRVLEDLPFGMFDTDGYHPGSSADIEEYTSVIWTHQKRSIPSTILVYIALVFCEPIMDPEAEEYGPFTMMQCYNAGVNLEALE